jgi:Transmembrane exosortase (Exosortase_EpsH)
MTTKPAELAPTYATAELILLACGLMAMYAQTYIVLDKQVWSFVGQGHGPVMLALAMWLAWERKEKLQAATKSNSGLLATVLMTVGIIFYVIGRSQDILLLDVGSQIPILAAILVAYRGTAGLRIMWFPLLFVVFLYQCPVPLWTP